MAITKEDIEAKALELADAVDQTKSSVRDKTMLGAVAVAAIVAAAFIIGRRRGARNKTMVEVYRV